MILGITGRVGSGKTEAADYIANHFDFRLIDLDLIGHDLLKEQTVKDSLIQLFGQNIMASNGDLIRSKIASIVFNDHDKLAQLNAVIHPLIKDSVKDKVYGFKRSCLIVGALLSDIEVDQYCDKVLVIDANCDNIKTFSPHKADRLSVQKSREQFLEMGSLHIHNNFDDSFFRQLHSIITSLLNEESK